MLFKLSSPNNKRKKNTRALNSGWISASGEKCGVSADPQSKPPRQNRVKADLEAFHPAIFLPI
jgi:hypothetical protein